MSMQLREALVDKLLRDGHLRSPRIADAFAAVPRELFVPEVSMDDAYRSSEAIVVKRVDGVGVSSASAPDVVALMLEQLDVHPGMRVLEIGAGTGYNAALLAHIVGNSGQVVTLDIDEDLVRAARRHLDQAGAHDVQVVQTDGALGFPDAEPFDRIILTVAAADIAPAWREQLRPGSGRLVLPLVLRGPQRTVAFVPDGGCLASVDVRGCGFMPLRGVLASAPLPRFDLEAVMAAVGSTSAHTPMGVEPLGGLELWLAVHDPAAHGERLGELVASWLAAGQPGDANVRIRAYPSSARRQAGSGEVVVEQRWTHFVLSWTHPPASLTR